MGIIATSRAEVSWPTQQQVAAGGSYNVYRDARDDVVDYSAPLNPSPIDAWPEGSGKIGAGLGPAGCGPAGYGGGGVGAGIGAAGLGPAGMGALMMTFATGLLPDGEWKFAVVSLDAAGNPGNPAAGTAAIATLAATPAAPGRPAIDSYDSGEGTMQTSFALSDDDE